MKTLHPSLEIVVEHLVILVTIITGKNKENLILNTLHISIAGFSFLMSFLKTKQCVFSHYISKIFSQTKYLHDPKRFLKKLKKKYSKMHSLRRKVKIIV